MQFLQNHSINRQQWDDCIEASSQNIIYAKSFYLDNICKGWKALTGKDYSWVLPLTGKSKWSIAYLYQPPFTQQLGIFSKPGVVVPFGEIIEWLQAHYKFWEVSWTSFSSLQTFTSLQVKPATNFVLSLAENYEAVAANYHGDLQRNLKRSKQFDLRYAPTTDYESCIAVYKKHYGDRIHHVKEEDYHNFSNICAHASKHNMLVCRQALNKGGELMATALLLRDKQRLYNMMNTTTEAGRKAGANHFLLDAIIREFAGSNMLFDFEGSDIPGVKTFYENFGAVNEPYCIIRYNRLPWLLRKLKS